MDNSYFLLSGRHYEMLRISFSSLYDIDFEGLYDECDIERGDVFDSTDKLLRKFDGVITKGGWHRETLEDMRMFISLNAGGMLRFAKGFRGLEVREFPSCSCGGVKYGYNGINACSFGYGINMGKHWSNVLGDVLKDLEVLDVEMYGEAFVRVDMSSFYELVIDYVYFCLVHMKGIEDWLKMLGGYRGVGFVKGFDGGIGCMFLRYYEWVSDDADGYKGRVKRLVGGYKKGLAGIGMELFKEGISHWCRHRRGKDEESYVMTEEFRWEFINSNLYGIRVMLECQGKGGVKDREYIDRAYYGIGKVVKRSVKRDLKIVGRFIEYVLAGCYVA